VPSHTRSRVLCVDDDQDACEMLSVLLKMHEIDATCVRSAAAAWQKINAENFDLYLLDGWMPGVDGIDFCRQLRASDANTPILFYSGAAYGSDKKKGMAAGANGYVAKPDVEALIPTILDLIANAKAVDVVGARAATAAPGHRDRQFSAEPLHSGSLTNFVLEG
jgi:two-component system OmpR family response regulator